MKIAETRQQTHLTKYDVEVLGNFVRLKFQTLGDILVNSNMGGSKTMECLHKLINFGFVRRDWETEMERRSGAVYTLTPEGRLFGKSSAVYS